MGTTGRMRAWQPWSITATIHRESREKRRALSSDGASEDAATSGAPTVGGAFQGGWWSCAPLFFSLTLSPILRDKIYAGFARTRTENVFVRRSLVADIPYRRSSTLTILLPAAQHGENIRYNYYCTFATRFKRRMWSIIIPHLFFCIEKNCICS